MTTLLIDGDEFLYKACSAAQTETNWGDDNITRSCDVDAVWATVRGQIKALMQRFDTPKVVFALTGTDNWRKTVLPTYKMNRAGTVKPVGYGRLRELALAHPAALMHVRLEADDVLGIKATNPSVGPTIIVSSDKDMASVPGTVWNPSKGTLKEHSPEDADQYHLLQTLMGDTSDGYKGCPGIGPKKAVEILHCEPEKRWPAIVKAFAKAGLTEEDALVQARVARILRFGEFHFPSSEVRLWTP